MKELTPAQVAEARYQLQIVNACMASLYGQINTATAALENITRTTGIPTNSVRETLHRTSVILRELDHGRLDNARKKLNQYDMSDVSTQGAYLTAALARRLMQMAYSYAENARMRLQVIPAEVLDGHTYSIFEDLYALVQIAVDNTFVASRETTDFARNLNQFMHEQENQK